MICVKEALKDMIAKHGPTYEAPMMIDVETIVADGCFICKTGGGAT